MLIVASGLSNWLSRGFDSWFLSIIGGLLSAFISLVIGLGLIRAALAILDGGRPSVEQLVSTKDIGPVHHRVPAGGPDRHRRARSCA